MHVSLPAEMAALISSEAVDNDRLMRCELPQAKSVILTLHHKSIGVRV